MVDVFVVFEVLVFPLEELLLLAELELAIAPLAPLEKVAWLFLGSASAPPKKENLD